jgi:hypothetical protein
MAITAGSRFVGGSSKSAATSLVVATTVQLSVGEVAVLVVSCDNTATSDLTDGTSNEITSVTDASGNVWSKVSECREGSAGAGAGAVVAVFRSRITTQLNSSGNITANFANSITARAMAGYRYTVGTGKTLRVAGTIQYAATEAADPPSMAISGLTSKEYLFFRAIGFERDNDDVAAQFVATTNYTTLAASGTTGAGAATNMSAGGEFRIVTATGETSNPSTSPGTGDHAHLFIAFEEADFELLAPASPQTDDVWVAVVHSLDQTAHTMDAAWTEVYQGNGGSTTSRLSVWRHRYAGSTPSLIVGHGSAAITGAIFAARGIKRTGDPVNVVGSGGSGTDASAEHSGITPSVDGCLLLLINGAAPNLTRTPPTDWTAEFEDTAGGTQNCYTGAAGSIAVHSRIQPTAAATGTVVDTLSGSGAWASVLIALAPDIIAAGEGYGLGSGFARAVGLGAHGGAGPSQSFGPPRAHAQGTHGGTGPATSFGAPVALAQGTHGGTSPVGQNTDVPYVIAHGLSSRTTSAPAWGHAYLDGHGMKVVVAGEGFAVIRAFVRANAQGVKTGVGYDNLYDGGEVNGTSAKGGAGASFAHGDARSLGHILKAGAASAISIGAPHAYSRATKTALGFGLAYGAPRLEVFGVKVGGGAAGEGFAHVFGYGRILLAGEHGGATSVLAAGGPRGLVAGMKTGIGLAYADLFERLMLEGLHGGQGFGFDPAFTLAQGAKSGAGFGLGRGHAYLLVNGSLLVVLYPIASATGPALYEPMIGAAEV